MKIKEKLTLGYLLMASIVVIVGLVTFGEIKEIEERFDEVAGEAFPLVEILEEMQYNAVRLADSAYQYSMLVSEMQHAKSVRIDPLQVTHRLEEESRKGFFRHLARLQRLSDNNNKEYQAFIDEIKKISRELIQQSDRLVKLKQNGVVGDPVIDVEEKLNDIENRLHEKLLAALIHEEEEVQEHVEELKHDIVEAKQIFLVATLVAFIFSIGLGIFFAKTIASPIVSLTKGAEEMAKTKFDTRVEVPSSKDEVKTLASSFNEMAEALGRTTVSRDYFQTVVNSMNNCMIVLHADGRIREVNQTTCYTLLYKDSELVGQPISKILDFSNFGDDVSSDNLGFLGFINNIPTNLKSKDGVEIPVLFSGATMSDADGELGGFVCVAQSFDELKKLGSQEKV